MSHLRPLWDFLRIGWLNTHLVTLRICLPEPYLALRVSDRYHRLAAGARLRATFADLFLRDPGSAGRIAASTGLGLFMGIAPFWGFQIALTLVAAHLLRLSKPIAVVASNISFPLMIPPILYASLVLGRLTVGSGASGAYTLTPRVEPADLLAWIIGSFLLALVVAVIGSAVAYGAVVAVRSMRRTSGATDAAADAAADGATDA